MYTPSKQDLELLEKLSQELGCLYLSDLRSPLRVVALERAAANLNAAAYSLQEWADAVHYLTGQNKKFQTPQEAKNYLCNALKMQRAR